MASIVNAVGEQPDCASGENYWQDTAILITWDDWGGWFDHVAPFAVNLQPGAPVAWGVGPGGPVYGNYADYQAAARGDALAEFFPLRRPRSFVAISTTKNAAYFQHAPLSRAGRTTTEPFGAAARLRVGAGRVGPLYHSEPHGPPA